jgi:hypothetical protein
MNQFSSSIVHGKLVQGHLVNVPFGQLFLQRKGAKLAVDGGLATLKDLGGAWPGDPKCED